MYKIILAFCFSVSILFPKGSYAQDNQNTDIQIGAYYFGGWTGKTNHITNSLLHEFPNRKPKWGWYASNPSIMAQEIDYAANAGIAFFSFCWYYVNSDSSRYKSHPLNSALDFFIKAPNSKRMKFNLLVANHEGTEVGPKDWNFVTDEWLNIFNNDNYLHVGDKPLITIFSIKHLVDRFGSTIRVKEALQIARKKAIRQGFKGINFAICLNDNAVDIKYAKECGFDIFTGYNYHYSGFNSKQVIPIDSLLNSSIKVWDRLARINSPYIPAITLNWDPRPWAAFNKKIMDSPRYSGFSERSIYDAIIAVKSWLKANEVITVKEKIAMVYAWNEYGEGAWLTPTKNNNKLIYLKKALKSNEY